MISRILSAAFCCACLTAIPSPAADIYLVRHAEKVTDGSEDPGLTALGEERARNLADMLRSARIERIFSSDFERTRSTAAPLAARLGLAVEIYDPGDLESLAKQLARLEQNCLVVGHSNTTPELADLMGGEGGETIAEAWEYDRLYLLQTENGRVTHTILFHVPPETSPPL